jgi:hypothetical protein
VLDAGSRYFADRVFGHHRRETLAPDLTGLDDRAARERQAERKRLQTDKPLRWISPMVRRAGDRKPPRAQLPAWSDQFVPFPYVVVSQNGTVLTERRLPWPAKPSPVFRIPSDVLERARPDGSEVRISLRR